MKIGRLIGLWCSVLLPFLFLGACSSRSDQSARQRPAVTLKIHCWEGYGKEHVEHFRQYLRQTRGQEVNLVITSTSGLDSFIEAIEKRGVHLVSPANDYLTPLKRKGLLRSVDLGRLSNFNQLNRAIVDTRCNWVDGAAYGVPFNFGAYLLAYNKDKVPPPTSYSVLWDPAYRKRVTIPAVYDTINIYMTALALGIPKEDLFRLSPKQLAKVEQKLRILCREQVSEYWYENLMPERREHFDVGMDWGIGVLKINEQFGGNWGVVVPREGATSWVDNWAMTRNITDPETEAVAYAWINYLISPESQARMARVTSYGPVNPYSTRYLSAEEKKKYYLTDPKFLNDFILWQPLDADVQATYRKVWERCKAP